MSTTFRATDVLQGRDEDDVEHKEYRHADIVLYDFPTIILRANLVTPFPPVIEAQTALHL